MSDAIDEIDLTVEETVTPTVIDADEIISNVTVTESGDGSSVSTIICKKKEKRADDDTQELL